MLDLKYCSTENLERELARRKRQRLREKPPAVLVEVDWSGVIEAAVARRDSVVAGTYHEDNDDDVYMFEEVMQAVFGEGYFSWENYYLRSKKYA